MSKPQSGFTLIEMMIALVVLTVLIVAGFPSFRAILRSNRIASQTNTFLASVNLARTEAIKNNFNAGICASSDGTSCSTAWNTGWIVFDDNNNNGALDGGERIVRVVRGNPDLSMTSSPTTGTLMFNPRGMFTNAAAINLTMQPNDCPSGYQGVRNFTLLQVGQMTVNKANCP